jgi:hypothetical protein
MSLFDQFAGPEPTDEEKGQQRLIDRALSSYYKWKIADKVVDAGVNHFSGGNTRDRLDETEKRLSIRLKKKQLGLPMDDDDYELATNEGLSFTQKGAVAAFGKRAAESIPRPDFLKPPTGHGLMGSAIPKTTSYAGAGDYLLSSCMRASGAKYGRAAGIVRRFFG